MHDSGQPEPANGADATGPHDGTQAGGRPDRPTDAVRATEELLVASEPSRFRIFIIDTGWNSAARKVLHDNLDLIHDLTRDDPAYVLDRDMSVALLRRHRKLIGRDPIISVHDVRALDRGGRVGVHGVRLHLGLVRGADEALLVLQSFTKFIARHRMSNDLEADMRRRLRRQGFTGAIEIIGGHFIGESLTHEY